MEEDRSDRKEGDKNTTRMRRKGNRRKIVSSAGLGAFFSPSEAIDVWCIDRRWNCSILSDDIKIKWVYAG
jgi:hypothetical protein